MLAIDAVTGQRRPSSGAFKPDADGVSIYRASRLAATGLGVVAVVRDPWNVVVALGVGDVRAVPLGVRDDPWPDDIDEPEHPRNAAHALITGWQGLGKNERRRRQRALAEAPSLRLVYP